MATSLMSIGGHIFWGRKRRNLSHGRHGNTPSPLGFLQLPKRAAPSLQPRWYGPARVAQWWAEPENRQFIPKAARL